MLNHYLKISPEVSQALTLGKPVVALESTIIAHGMPYPKNVETALAVENIVRKNGATPATIAIIDGKLCAGLSEKEIRRIGFPLSANLIERGRHIAQGTIDCAYLALQNGCAMNVAGGTHHSFADHGEGFCVLNDFAIAANHLLNNKVVAVSYTHLTLPTKRKF